MDEVHWMSLATLHQLPLLECTFPELLFIHSHPFSCLNRTLWDGVKQDVCREEPVNPGSPGRTAGKLTCV